MNAYNAVITYAHAFSSLFAQGKGDSYTASELKSSLLQVSFEGVAGSLIEFKPNGDRLALYDIVIVDNGTCYWYLELLFTISASI